MQICVKLNTQKGAALQSLDLSWPYLLILKYVPLARENMVSMCLRCYMSEQLWSFDCTVHFGKDGLTCQPKRAGSESKTFNTFKQEHK